MARDRIIRFTKSPPRDDLEKLLTDYLAGIGTVQRGVDRLFCSLPGKGSHALRRLTDHPLSPAPEDRGFEVWSDETCVDVITRMADDVTNAVADGIASIITRFWRGEREEP